MRTSPGGGAAASADRRVAALVAAELSASGGRSVGEVLARPWGRVAAVVAVAVAAGLVARWFAARDSGGSHTAQHGSSSADVAAKTLRALVDALGRPVYWAGPQHGVTYEFTETADRRIYVRYLPAGVAAGSAHAYLTVASYPVVNAFAVTRAAADQQEPGSDTGTYTRPRRASP